MAARDNMPNTPHVLYYNNALCSNFKHIAVAKDLTVPCQSFV